MTTDKPYWKTVITVTVLTDNGPLPDGVSLGEIESMMGSSAWKGNIEWDSCALSAEEMQKHREALDPGTYTCEYCTNTPMPGIHCPSDFDDREPSADGKVFVAKCDECGKYASDTDAAEAVKSATGWPIERSYDREDHVDPDARKDADPNWCRPYFKISIAQALDEVG